MAREKKLASKLQELLEIEEIDSRRYLDHQPELSEEVHLAKRVQDSRGHLDPSPDFLKKSSLHLAARLKMEKKPRARTSAKIRFAMQSRTAAAIAICTVILFVLINGTVAVNASKVSIPGDPVYPVKKLVESAQLAFTFSKDGDTELYIQMAKTRATEMQYLALEGRYELIPATAQAYIRNINRAIVLLDAVHADRSPRAEELNIQMMEVLSAHETLAVMLDMVPPDTRTEIATTLNTSAISSQIAQAIFGK